MRVRLSSSSYFPWSFCNWHTPARSLLPTWSSSARKSTPSPTAAPIENAVIVIRDGKIAEIGPDGRVKAPKGVPFIDLGGKVITAGFWNSHVHFTEAVWNGAARPRRTNSSRTCRRC